MRRPYFQWYDWRHGSSQWGIHRSLDTTGGVIQINMGHLGFTVPGFTVPRAVQPGTAGGIIAAMWEAAGARGHNPTSARHALSFLVDELDAARAKLGRVEELHQKTNGPRCGSCDYVWPCPTIRAVRGLDV